MLIAIRGDLKASQALAAAAVTVAEEKEEEETTASTDKNEKVPTG